MEIIVIVQALLVSGCMAAIAAFIWPYYNRPLCAYIYLANMVAIILYGTTF